MPESANINSMMTHEEYITLVNYTPLERYRAVGKFQHECEFKHIIYSSAEHMLAGRRCAHCDSPDHEHVIATIRDSGMQIGGSMYKSGGHSMIVLLDSAGRGRPFPINDLGNGLYPGIKLLEITGMYLYYMRIKDMWKVGVSKNPRRRLSLHHPTLLGMWYYDREASARLEEARIKEKYKQFRNKNRKALGPNDDGWTEMFTKDVLGLDNV